MAGWVRSTVVSLALVGAVLGLLPTLAAAADWRGLVIGQSGPGAERAFGDAFHTTAALAAQGGRDVLMMRDTTRAAIENALADWPPGATAAVLWVGGPVQDGALALPDGNLPLVNLLDLLAARGVNRVALMIEDCVARDGAAVPPVLPQPRAGQRLLLATSSLGDTCPADGTRLTDRLRRASAGASLQSVLADLVRSDTLGELVPASEAPPALASPILADATPVTGALVLPGLTAGQVPVIVAASAVLTALSPIPQADLGPADLASFPTGRESRPTRPGLPRPSIIIGMIAGATPASLPVSPDAEGLPQISFDDVPGRAALRGRDPALFASLVASGVLDPPDEILAASIQTELQRMNCYTSRVDGIWGNGSRAAVGRYFAQRPGTTAESQEPTVGLFRQIIGAEDVACPVTTTATGPAAPRQPGGAPRNTPTPAVVTPRVTQQAPAAQPRIGPGIGVFR